ncbi:MAG: elongation factor P [Verrucomicrobia bacterium]|nr:elongation factor P [Verrucomicrobiota bacterium]
MAQVDAGDIRKGMKLEIDGVPYNVVQVDLVKPGKGQAFTRTRIKNLKTGLVIEKTFKSNESVGEADVREANMRLLYKETDGAVFMDDESFEQVTIPMSLIGDNFVWLMDEMIYRVVFYKGDAVDFIPPTFLEMTIVETAPGERGNTSGRVLKAAKTHTGAEIQVPIFIDEGEKVKVDTRTGEYVSRV